MINKQLNKRFQNSEIDCSLPFLNVVMEKGPVSQKDVAKELGVTLASANMHFQRLHHEGYVVPCEGLASGRGRPSLKWDFAWERNFTVSIVLMPPVMYMGMADWRGMIVSELKREFHIGEGLRLPDIEREIADYYSCALSFAKAAGGTVRCTFGGLPGLMEKNGLHVERACTMPVLDGLSIFGVINGMFGDKCVCRSISYPIFWGVSSMSQDSSNIMIIIWDLGLGVLLGSGENIFNYAVPRSNIWDIGHTRFRKNGAVCRCGKRGCLEAYCGGWSMLQKTGDKSMSLGNFIDYARKGSRPHAEILRSSAKELGESLSQLMELFSVTKVVVTGPLAKGIDIYKNSLREGLGKLLAKEEIEEVQIHAELSPENITRGGCHGARNFFLKSNTRLKTDKSGQ